MRSVRKAECTRCRADFQKRKALARPKRYRPDSIRPSKVGGKLAVRALLELGIDLGYRPVSVPEPIAASSRREALELGAIRYFTGKPCKHGHISSRTVHWGCDECKRRRVDRKPGYRGKIETKRAGKKRSRERQQAAVAALKELGIQI